MPPLNPYYHQLCTIISNTEIHNHTHRGPPNELHDGIASYIAQEDPNAANEAINNAVQWPALTQVHVAGWPVHLGIQGGVQVLVDGQVHATVDGGRVGENADRHLVLDIAEANIGPLRCGVSLQVQWRSAELQVM